MRMCTCMCGLQRSQYRTIARNDEYRIIAIHQYIWLFCYLCYINKTILKNVILSPSLSLWVCAIRQVSTYHSCHRVNLYCLFYGPSRLSEPTQSNRWICKNEPPDRPRAERVRVFFSRIAVTLEISKENNLWHPSWKTGQKLGDTDVWLINLSLIM